MATRRSSFGITARVLAVTLALVTLTVVLAAPAGVPEPNVTLSNSRWQ